MNFPQEVRSSRHRAACASICNFRCLPRTPSVASDRSQHVSIELVAVASFVQWHGTSRDFRFPRFVRTAHLGSSRACASASPIWARISGPSPRVCCGFACVFMTRRAMACGCHRAAPAVNRPREQESHVPAWLSGVANCQLRAGIARPDDALRFYRLRGEHPVFSSSDLPRYALDQILVDPTDKNFVVTEKRRCTSLDGWWKNVDA